MPSNHSSSTAQKPDRRHYDDSRPIRAEYKYHVAGIDSLTDLSPTRSCALSLASTSQPLSALTCRRLYCCSGSILELCRADLNLILLLLSPLASLFPFSVCFTFFFFFLRAFFCVRESMLLSSIYRKHSTVHAPCTNQRSKPVSTCRSERGNASQQIEFGESQHIVEHSHSSLCYQNERRH